MLAMRVVPAAWGAYHGCDSTWIGVWLICEAEISVDGNNKELCEVCMWR